MSRLFEPSPALDHNMDSIFSDKRSVSPLFCLTYYTERELSWASTLPDQAVLSAAEACGANLCDIFYRKSKESGVTAAWSEDYLETKGGTVWQQSLAVTNNKNYTERGPLRLGVRKSDCLPRWGQVQPSEVDAIKQLKFSAKLKQEENHQYLWYGR